MVLPCIPVAFKSCVVLHWEKKLQNFPMEFNSCCWGAGHFSAVTGISPEEGTGPLDKIST